MGVFMLLGIALSLAMDSGAVAIASSIKLCQVNRGQLLRMSLAFGFFQFIMPVLGWYLGQGVVTRIQSVGYWVAFALLVLVGGHMLWEALQAGSKPVEAADPTRGWKLFFLSIATSIDALAVGVSFSMLGFSIWLPATVIGVITAGVTALGLQLGCRLGNALGRKMDLAGGLVLIAIGVLTLLGHG